MKGTGGRLAGWADQRAAPVAATVVMLLTVMLFSLVNRSGLGVGGMSFSAAGGDLWSLAASSWALAHGQLAHIYVRHGALTSPPALEFVLAPVLLLGQSLGIAYHGGGSAGPTALWLLLGPASLVLASTVLFAVDAVARHWRLADGRRLALALVGAFGVANVAAMWGHPEDCVAFACIVWAALALERRGPAAGPTAAILLGVGIAFQPLAILGVAPVLTRLGWNAAARLWWRLLLPSVAALLAPLWGEPGRTFFVLDHQPFLPAYVSSTPLSHLAPVLARGVVGGGPTRMIATVLSAALAVAVCRKRHDLATVLTMVAVAFFLRVLLETELNWYYLWPVPAMCLPLAMRRGTTRFWLCSVALVVSLGLADRPAVHHIVLWWPALMATLTVMLLSIGPSPRGWAARLSRPRRRRVAAGPVECGAMVRPVGAGLRGE
jgi:hypothetical protein